MRSTTGQDTVANNLRTTAETITTQLLDGRQLLPSAANGRPPLPADPHVAHTMHAMRNARSTPVYALLSVAKANLEDGVPYSEVIAAFRAMERAVEVLALSHEARKRVIADRPIPTIMHRETKAQARLDLAQLKLAESPESAEALADVLAEARRYEETFTELTTACETRLAVVRCSPSPVYGQRRDVRMVR